MKIQPLSNVTDIRINLYLNDEMEYRIKIIESTQRQTSTFVLRKVHGVKVLETLNQLRRFYGLTPLDLIDLKIAIAKNGGYIPGALVL